MFSRTTIALSTTMPTAKAIPASKTTLRLLPTIVMTRKVPITETGMVAAIITVALPLRRNSSSTSTARNPPTAMFLTTR